MKKIFNEGEMRYKALILQNARGEGPGVFADFLKVKDWDSETIHLDQGGVIPSAWRSCDLLVVMGGPMNVYEEVIYPYLIEETKVIGEALQRGLPVLGFCLGAQLMAKSFGAKVMKGHKKEIGWYRVQMTDEGGRDPFLRLFPKELFVFQWHSDTFQLPEGAVRLVCSDDYMNQAMRVGSMGYGFQFHFEITREMIDQWLVTGQEEVEEMGEKGVSKKILKDAEIHLSEAHAYAALFFNNYLDEIVRSSEPGQGLLSGG
ncbi:MAG: type 1 glutamine amidotransferase [Pseudomonadota bacterium]